MYKRQADLLCSAAAAEKRGAAARKPLFLCLGRAEIYAAHARLHRAGPVSYTHLRLRAAQHMFSLQAEFPVIHRSTLRFLFVLSFLTGLFKNKHRK